jgi:excisionase family DNA binding protein
MRLRKNGNSGIMVYFAVDELSDYLKMSRSTIYKKTMDRQIPFIKAGKKLLFKQEAIDLWLEDHSELLKSAYRSYLTSPIGII